jgi:hypothetical protein
MKQKFDQVQAEADGMRVAARLCENKTKDLELNQVQLKVKVAELERRPGFWSGVAVGSSSLVLLLIVGAFALR